jgi:hypothetical protein
VVVQIVRNDSPVWTHLRRAEHGMMHYASIFGRAWLIVFLTAANVGFISRGEYVAAFATGGMLSYVWWTNSRTAAHSTLRFGRIVYALGAACGTVSGMALARWWTGA